MTRQERAVAKALDKLCATTDRLRVKVALAREELVAAGCTHPVMREFSWEHDNGYGRQTTNIGLRCTLCLHENRWPK